MSTEFRERKKVINIRPYGFRLSVIVSTDVRLSFQSRKLSITQPSATSVAFVWTQSGCGTVYAFLPEKLGLGATAHEMLHVVSFVMKEVGAEFEEEVWAYHLEELTQMVTEFIHKEESVGSVKNRK